MTDTRTAAQALAHVLLDHRMAVARLNKLIETMDDARLAEQPHGQVNHPLWTLGHLVVVLDRGCTFIGGQATVDSSFGPRYGGGSQPTANRADYPAKSDLLSQVNAQSQRLMKLMETCPAEKLEAQNPVEAARGRFPQVGDILVHMLTGEPQYHLGQLTGWNRAMGWPVKF